MITEPDEPRGPLDGIKVVELGVWVAGPGAAGILADWGADVVKIEPPGGDPARGFQRMLGGDLDVNPVFGLDGPDADRAAYDIAAFWARAGIAESLRVPGGPLPLQRGGMGDHSVAMTAAGMISAALVARTRTGRGQLVTTSLLRQGAFTVGFDVNVALMWGRTIGIGVREKMGSPTINNYVAGDGRP